MYTWDAREVTQKPVVSYALLATYLFVFTSLVSYADVFADNTPSLLQQAVDKLFNKNETEKAIDLLRHTVKKDLSSGEAYYYLGLANV